mmetsp:Transcript_16613/g.24591  ORF Transcript_16613/g.24591 Transcript_16613/m.24591 type:complete len:220 (+) Transcript_16613:76-735(+)|eukprot:CAMPEP_0171461586 /NCGR_PEP_ID=MMETSP0945-20130129/5972_1 /TAXON_ID=109269 /ORGANISM="Vaucheria litorea, Strain CCMP2940" /LENGTH=219 /DNA_ID=CAMNT_0011987957 /DNA_START=74 /DNA_END=733 /DNA_ORIENTATION=+
MFSIFESYSDEFSSLRSEIQSLLSHAATYETEPSAKSSKLRQGQNLISQAEEILKQMDIEARNAPDQATQNEHQSKLKTYKRGLASLKNDLKSAEEQIKRDGLFSKTLPHEPEVSKDDKERLLRTGDALSRQSEMLTNAKRSIFEIEDVAGDISLELGRNRETISSAHSKVREVSEMTSNARRLVHRMGKRETRQRTILWGVGFSLTAVIILVIYFGSK